MLAAASNPINRLNWGSAARLPIDAAAERLARFFQATTELMQVLARAMGHESLDGFTIEDLTTFDREMAHLTGIAYGGVAVD